MSEEPTPADPNAPDLAGLDPNDPDAIAACPPEKVIDAKTHFQIGKHEGMWSEYDDRGVPQKNIKKKKPTKKEKDALETEYLDASKAYQKYMKDVENWEQSKLDSEKALKKSDRLRWSFRQVGEKHAPIEPDDMEHIIKLMGWLPLTQAEFKVVKKGLLGVAVQVDGSAKVQLEALRVYVRDVMPIDLLEQSRLMSDQLDAIELEELYSPRTWRKKLEDDPPKKKKSPRGSARKDTSSKSPRNNASPRGSARKQTMDKGAKAAASPRGKKPAASAKKK